MGQFRTRYMTRDLCILLLKYLTPYHTPPEQMQHCEICFLSHNHSFQHWGIGHWGKLLTPPTPKEWKTGAIWRVQTSRSISMCFFDFTDEPQSYLKTFWQNDCVVRTRNSVIWMFLDEMAPFPSLFLTYSLNNEALLNDMLRITNWLWANGL